MTSSRDAWLALPLGQVVDALRASTDREPGHMTATVLALDLLEGALVNIDQLPPPTCPHCGTHGRPGTVMRYDVDTRTYDDIPCQAHVLV